MSLIRHLFIVAMMCSLSACFMAKEKPYIEVVEGWFYTPNGKYEVGLVSEFQDSTSWSISTNSDKHVAPNVYLTGIGEGVEFLFGPLTHYNKVMLNYRVRKDGSSFIGKLSAEYQFKAQIYKVHINNPFGGPFIFDGGEVENFQMFPDDPLPPTLARYGTVLRGGGLTKSQLAVYEKYEDEPHRIVIPFKIGEDEYKFDVTFKVTTKTDWVGFVPGV